MKKRFKFKVLSNNDDELSDGVIEVEQRILDEGLSQEFKDSFYTFADEAAVAAHLAWAMTVRDMNLSQIEGWIFQKGDVVIIDHPSGWDDFSVEAKEVTW